MIEELVVEVEKGIVSSYHPRNTHRDLICKKNCNTMRISPTYRIERTINPSSSLDNIILPMSHFVCIGWQHMYFKDLVKKLAIANNTLDH